MTVLYTDLSHHDWDRCKGELDWARIRAATSPVVCLRATYGDPAGYNPTTRHFADMALGARRAGMDLIGGYHNLIRGDAASIARQVDYLRRELDRVGATWAMLDVERYPELVSNGLWPRFDDVSQFVSRWRAVDRRVLAIYLPRWIWDGHMGRPDLRPLRCPLVASDYGTNPDGSPSAVYQARGGDSGRGWNAYGGVTPSVWQFGSNIDCPGASGQTDVNAFRGSLTELRAFLTTGSEADDMSARAENEIHQVFTGLFNGGSSMGRSVDPDGIGSRPADNSLVVKLDYLMLMVDTIAAKVGLSAEQMEQIRAAAREGSASAADALVAAVVAKLPEDIGGMTREQLANVVAQGVRDAFAGGLAAPTAE